MIVGAGKGGTAIFKILKETAAFDIKVVIDKSKTAPGVKLAFEEGIQIGTDWRPFINEGIDIVIEVTGDPMIFETLRRSAGKKTLLIPGSVAFLFALLMEEKENLFQSFKTKPMSMI